MKKTKKMLQIQYWQITTFGQNVIQIGGTTYNKSISQLLLDDDSFKIWECSDGTKYLFSKTLTSTQLPAQFSANGGVGGVIIGGTHPTCS
jgi:hypothetical protein